MAVLVMLLVDNVIIIVIIVISSAVAGIIIFVGMCDGVILNRLQNDVCLVVCMYVRMHTWLRDEVPFPSVTSGVHTL